MYGSHFWTRVVSSNDLPIISADSSHVFSDGNNWSAISGCFQTTTSMVLSSVGICNTLLKRILYHTVRTANMDRANEIFPAENEEEEN
ncbi:hypothetical protein T02_10699 [Trichinella nativa]|uniref:Uncharacterized protein n=1 Tax=Trichinella nativa TaxID=6335 RepID=A0A0V1LVS0_9BILA|nr:hypothetical protein T02_10699 [Trichinella nativa]